MKLKFKKDIIENKTISNEAMFAYVGIVLCYKNGLNAVLTNKNMINYYLTHDECMPRRFEENLKKGMQELIDNKIIICRKKIGIDIYCDLFNIKLDDNDKFVFIDVEDIIKITTMNHKNKLGILRLYLCMVSTFISKNHIKDIRNPDKYNNILGMMSQEYLETISGLSHYAVIEYLKILEQMNLIYVSRCSFAFKDQKGKIKSHNNIYGRYIDKELIDEFANIRYSMYDDLHQVKSMISTNNARSLMQKYNCLRNNTKYDKKTVAAIYEYVCKYNEKYPKKAKDMKPFEKYGYKIEKN